MNKIVPPVFSLLQAHPIPTYALMRTKFYLPRTSSDIVPRSRLLERLNTGRAWWQDNARMRARWFWQDNLAGRVAQVDQSLNSLALTG
jgi:hypothetical protein